MDKYKVVEHRSGVASTHGCSNLHEIRSVISYLISKKAVGESINVTIIKNK